MPFKEDFQEVLKNRIGNKKHWAEELASVLQVSIHAIYKKTRQESFYSIDEIVKLMQHYSISIDELVFKGSDFVKFKMPQLNAPIKTIDDYLQRLQNTLSSLHQTTNVKIFYATRELPIFYYFLDDQLAAFKLFVFSKTVWNLPSFKNAKFSLQLFDPELFVNTKQIWKNYSHFYSEEYWNNNVLDNSLQQLLFFSECLEIHKSDAISIANGLKEVVFKCKQMAIDGTKNGDIKSLSKHENFENNYRLYDNKILHTSNHVRVTSDTLDAVYLTYDNPNFIITQDERFLSYTDQWYKAILENSYNLGRGSGHHSADFFNVLLSKIEATQQRIQNLPN